MHIKGDFNYGEGEGFQALELPYQGGKLSMVVLLPSKAGGLAALEKTLDSKKLAKCLEQLRKEEVEVAFPRFKITFEIELTPALQALGMEDAFSPAAADFSGMTGKRDLFLSNVVHKAFVEVNEEGTEAAAATGAVMTLTAMRPPRVFRADRPFLFFIRDCAKGTILFMGFLTSA
jgi:serpin B